MRLTPVERVAVPAILLALAGAAAGPTKAPVGTARLSVLLVTVDTLRADRLSAKGAMPRLAALASRGIVFTRAHALCPLTLPSHATILTGRDVRHHGVRDNIGHALPRDVPTVAEAFAAAGYRTGAFIGGYPLAREFGLERGFSRYDDRMTRTTGGTASGHTERRAAEVVRAALDWLTAKPPGPFFLWVHLYDPHEPYEAPVPFAGTHPLPYDDEVAYADDALGKLLDGIASGGRAAGLTVVVTSDHGESLGEHGEATHGVFLYESTLRVPLVIFPALGGVPGTVDEPVTLADVAPTLLAVAGLPQLRGGDGRVLLDAAARKGARPGEAPPPVYIESVHGRRRYGWASLYGVLDWPHKYVAAPRPEIYDLSEDPAESRNRADPEGLARFSERLAELRAATPGPSEEARADLERLASLGYVGGTGSPAIGRRLDDRPRPDPKDRIAAIPSLERGLADLAAGRTTRARKAFDETLRTDPENLVAVNNLGILALRAGDAARAESLFRKGLASDPSAENLANNLGLALSRQGKTAEAAEAYRAALSARPGFTAARFNLALALHRLGRDDESNSELDRIASEEPGFPELDATRAEVRRAIEKRRPPSKPPS